MEQRRGFYCITSASRSEGPSFLRSTLRERPRRLGVVKSNDIPTGLARSVGGKTYQVDVGHAASASA
jgi:hypothetical protein